MKILALLGLALVVAGLLGLGFCIRQGIVMRRGGLPPEEIQARLARLIAVNLGSVALAGLGLACLLAGLLL
jgi:hypothetical protein